MSIARPPARPLLTALFASALTGIAALQPAGHPGLATARLGPSREGPLAQPVQVGADRRLAFRLQAPGRLTWSVRVPRTARLRFALHAEPADAAPGVRLLADGAAVHEETWGATDGRWQERSVDLGARADREVEFVLEATGAGEVRLANPALVGPGARPAAPNVILYVVDCLRADHVGAYGYPRPTTPAIDRLARDGVLFENAQACASWTKPSIGCLFTSLLPYRHGARTRDDSLDPQVPTLAEAFGSAGYATTAWVANAFVSSEDFQLTRGFDQVVDTAEAQLNINDVEADAAEITVPFTRWLEANRERRFFAYLHSLDLHEGYRRRAPFGRAFVRPDSEGAQRDIDLYDTELAYNDREIGRLMTALAEQGLYDRTVVAITADHGEEFGEHGVPNHGHSLFQTAIHVPLVIKLPDSQWRGSRFRALASNRDVGPTLLGLAGLDPTAVQGGQSLVPVIERRTSRVRDVVLAELESSRELIYAARDLRYKYIHQILPRPRSLLFDLSSDPGEERDLMADPPAQARAVVEGATRLAQLAQAGYHLAARAGEARVEVVAETAARFRDVLRIPIRSEDLVRKAGHRVTFAFTGARHLMLRTEPPQAPLRVAIRVEGRPVDPTRVGLGPSAAPAPAVPFDLRAAEVGTDATQARALLERAAPEFRAWWVAEPRPSAEVSEETEQQLRALGYVD